MKRVVFLGAAAATLVQFTKYDLTALQTLGCEIHMVCNMQNGNLSEAALHEYNQTFPQLHWHDLPFADSAAALRRNHQAYQKLLPLLKELKPDLLHCHGTIAGQYGRRAAQELGIPVFYTAHDFRVFHGCLLAERVYFSAVERKYRKATELFFAVCPEDAAYAKKHLNQAEVVSLPDVGLDCDKYAMPERSREVVRNELDIPQDAVVLLSVGTLRMQKRLRVILQAMARLRNREQLHYVICGEGPDMPFLQKLTRQLHLEERVHPLGYRTDIPDMLGAADIFCMPSRREGCGMAALEAMAAGLPLITVRSHGTKTYAEKGESGFCLKGDLVTSCADAIEQLADNKLLRRQMGARNRAAATAFSDADRMMLLRGYYQKALGD